MHFDPWTLGLQAANFLVLVWLLHRFLYKPVLAVIAARQATADKLTTEVEAQKQAAEALRLDLEQRQQALSDQHDTVVAAAQAEAEAACKAILAKAEQEAKDLKATAEKALERQRTAAVRSMGEDASRLAMTIVRRLLAESDAGVLQARALDLICRDIKAMPAEARQHIGERLTSQATPVTVATAAAVSPAAAKRFAVSLSDALGAPVEPSFRVDQALISGVEVRFPFTILTRAWSQDLKRIETELTHDDVAQNVA